MFLVVWPPARRALFLLELFSFGANSPIFEAMADDVQPLLLYTASSPSRCQEATLFLLQPLRQASDPGLTVRCSLLGPGACAQGC